MLRNGRDGVLTTKGLSTLPDSLGLLLLDLCEASFFGCFAFESLDVLPGITHGIPCDDQSPVRFALGSLGLHERVASGCDGTIFMVF